MSTTLGLHRNWKLQKCNKISTLCSNWGLAHVPSDYLGYWIKLYSNQIFDKNDWCPGNYVPKPKAKKILVKNNSVQRATDHNSLYMEWAGRNVRRSMNNVDQMHTKSIANFLCSDTVEECSAKCPDTNYVIKISYISTHAWWKIWNTSIFWLLRSWINTPFHGQRAYRLDYPKPQCKRCVS